MPELSWFENPDDGVLYGCNMSRLQLDEAYIIPRCIDVEAFSIYQKHKECEGCPFTDELYRATCSEVLTPFIIRNVPQYLYQISTESYKIVPHQDTIGEFGIYKLQISNDTCWFDTIKEPVSIYFPILTVFLIYCAIYCVLYLGNYIWKRLMIRDADLTEKPKKKERVKSLDTFRGISIVVMIFANYGSGGYEFIEHAAWNGLHVADLVFPWFMWIMGACIPISLASSFRKGNSNAQIIQNVLIRSMKLFCVGIFLQSGTTLKSLRIFGVLQRFGVAYFFVTLICVFCMEREAPPAAGSKIRRYFGDILKLWRCWLVNLTILLAYLLIVFLVHDDGCPMGYFGPGGWHKNGSHFDCTGGATGYIDNLILGDHIYKGLDIRRIYGAKAMDPEGLVGCLTTIVHVFIGVQAGATLMVYKNHKERLVRWLSWAIITGLIGGGLCGFSKNDGVIPVNKNLWSVSYSLVTSCFAFTLLSFCYVLVDLKKWWTGKPFFYPGMNAILMYIGHEIIYQQFPVRWTVDGQHRTHFLNFFENIWGASFWILVSIYLYKINYFFVI